MGIVETARIALRQSRDAGTDWREPYREAVLAAERAGDREALATLTGLAAAKLLAEGDAQSAIGELDFGIEVADRPATRAHLLAVKSAALLQAARPAEAEQAMRAAHGAPAPEVGSLLSFELRTYDALLHLTTLRWVDPNALLRLGLDAQQAGFEWLHGGLLRWVIPWLFAVGRGSDTSPWIDLLRANGQSHAHSWRCADALLFEQARRALREDALAPPTSPELVAPEHRVRVAMLVVSRATDVAVVAAALEVLEAERAHVPLDMRSTLDGVHAYAQARFGATVRFDRVLPPPVAPSLMNLAGGLAGAMAAGLSGDRTSCEDWLVWLALVPPHIVTSAEWPVPISDVRAVLEGPVFNQSTKDAGVGAVTRNGRLKPTARELEVLERLDAGLTFRDIGRELDISEHTVHAHTTSLYRKLGVRGRVSALRAARESAWLS